MARSPGVAIVLAALVLFTMFAAAAPPKLRVVATLPDLYVITKALVGDAAAVEVIARFGQNPHDMEVRPSHMLMLRRADLLVRNGLEEDAWIDVIALGSNKSEDGPRHAHRHRGIARDPGPEGPERAG